MSATHDIYAAQPAFPFLASSLLAAHDMRSESTSCSSSSLPSSNPAATTTDRSSWDLRPSFNQVHNLSEYRNKPQCLFRCGSTIGFSYLRKGRKNYNDDTPTSDVVNKELLGQVSKSLLARYLLGLKDGTQARTRVFIIRPSHSSVFVPDALLDAILEAAAATAAVPPLSRDQAIDLLDSVELLTIHDFAAATRAISQVADALYAMQRQQQHPDQDGTNPSDDDDDNDKADVDDDSQSKEPTPTVLLIIEGLDAMADDVIRNSDALHGSAVLTPTLRMLTYLARSYASFVAVALVNTTGLGSSPLLPPHHTLHPSRVEKAAALPDHDVGRSGGGDDDVRVASRSTRNIKNAGGLYSAFARADSHAQETTTTTTTTKVKDTDNTDEPVPLLHTLLARTMDQAIDVHLLVQVRKGQSLVEIVKDRTGNGLGKWCLWD